MSNHTPDPWREYNADGARIFKNWRVMAENGRLVAVVADVDDSDHANARLIAAAPELLAALTELETFSTNTLHELDDQQTGWYYQLQAATQKARAAIAKATA